MAEPYPLQSRLDLSVAETLAKALRSRMGADLVLDAAAVTHLGGLCLQVLISAARTTQRSGHKFSVINASDRVVEQLAALGFSPETLGGTAS